MGASLSKSAMPAHQPVAPGFTWAVDQTTVPLRGAGPIGKGPRGEVVVGEEYAIIYIQDTGHARWLLENTPEQSKKYHLFHCHTIEQMLDQGRFERYVASVRRDGFFPVHSREDDGRTGELDAQLSPCRNCLAKTAHRGDPQSFDLRAYLEQLVGQRIGPLPGTWATDGRPSDYPPDWKVHSLKTRERAGFRCQCCRVDLNDKRHLLDAHHLDGVKSNVATSNLIALCKICHQEQPQHGRMRVKKEEREAIIAKRRQLQRLLDEGS